VIQFSLNKSEMLYR